MDVQFYPVWDLKCGKVAFYTGRAWWNQAPDDRVMMARDVIYPDGREPRAGDVMRCGACGRGVEIEQLTNVRPVITFPNLR